MVKQASIIGCGWLGFPLAKSLIKKGVSIKGSTTSSQKLQHLKEASIEPFKIILKENTISGNIETFLDNSELVIINIPPGLRKNPTKNHVSEIKNLAKAIETAKVENVIYISSTSVYKDEDTIPIITEHTKPNNQDGSSQLIDIENLLLKDFNFNTCILRFGGLIDEQRHPVKFLTGKKNLDNPNGPINLIHKNDCIAIIEKIIDNNLYNIELNAVNPKHPTRKTYYREAAIRYGLELPEFKKSTINKGKIIDSSKLVRLLNYQFKHAL